MVHDIIIFSSNEGDRVWCCYLWAFNLITIIVYVHAFQRIEHITTLLLWKRNTMIHHNGTQSIMLPTYTPNKYIHKYYDPNRLLIVSFYFILFCKWIIHVSVEVKHGTTLRNQFVMGLGVEWIYSILNNNNVILIGMLI